MSDDTETEETVVDVWDMQCPKCGDCDHICIAGTAWMTLTVDGTDADSDHEWDDDSAARCEKCDFFGTVRDFQVDEDAPDMRETLDNIAREYLGFELKDQRGSERLDFRDVCVCSLREALTAAYEVGKAAKE